VRIALHGATGRMGQAIVRLVKESGSDQIVGAIAHAEAPEQGRDVGELASVGPIGVEVSADVGAALLGAEVVIDFSNARAVPSLARAAARAKVALVVGTTGVDATGAGAIEQAAREVPVLWAPNMSLGIEVLAEMARMAVKALGADYDVEIVETHHRHKVDAPSGTALRLADAVREARGDLSNRYGREGNAGPRPDGEMAVLALRGGDVIGDHTIHLLGPGERFEITHRATHRDIFARGALRAARWLVGRAPGRYTVRDMLR
jgi:4-hydroxy-tetrahydrodipicolinate reductase